MGLSVSLLLLACVSSLWAGVESRSVTLTDRLVWQLQARVSGMRLERDLRAACAPDDEAGPFRSLVLEATSSRLVLITFPGSEVSPELVAWEISAGRLMRRRGAVEDVVGLAPGGGWRFADHKTMLEMVAPGTSFHFFTGNRLLPSPVSGEVLAGVDRVELRVVRDDALGGGSASALLCSCGVGR